MNRKYTILETAGDVNNCKVLDKAIEYSLIWHDVDEMGHFYNDTNRRISDEDIRDYIGARGIFVCKYQREWLMDNDLYVYNSAMNIIFKIHFVDILGEIPEK